MSFRRIKGVFLQELFHSKRALEVIMDLFFFPLMSIVVFGFLSTYLSGGTNKLVGHYVLMGMLLWQIIFITQYSVTVGSLWNIWSRNLSNMFVTPLRVPEYIFAHTLSGVVKATIVFLITSVLSIFVFHFNIFSLGFTDLLIFFVSFIFFAFSTGIIILGLIFRFGNRISALAWGLLPMFQPLTAAFYPVKVLPGILQAVASILPPTYIFEAARASLVSSHLNWNLILISFGENILYFLFAVWFFIFMFNKSKETGQFARNEG